MNDKKVENKFNRDGFAIYPQSLLSEGERRESLAAVKSVLAGEFSGGHKPWGFTGVGDPKQIQRVGQIHLCNKVLHNLIRSSKIGELAAQYFGAKSIKVWGTQLYYKPAGSGRGGNVGFHRDSQHMPWFASGSFTAWLALTEVNTDSGALTFVKGSHHWPRDSKFSGAEKRNRTEQRMHLKREYQDYEWREEKALLPAGGISFHHQDLLHGSGENQNDSDRCGIAIGLLTEEVIFNDEEKDYGFAAIINHNDRCPLIYHDSRRSEKTAENLCI